MQLLYGYRYSFLRKNDPSEAIERIGKGKFEPADSATCPLFLELRVNFVKILYLMLDRLPELLDPIFLYIDFTGVRSRIDVGVINGLNEDAHYFVNVADIHL